VAKAAHARTPKAAKAASARASAAGGHSAPARTPAGSVAAHLLWLQGTAGNRAVSRIVQRQVPPTTPSVDMPMATRLAEAAAAVKKGDIDAVAWAAWRTGGGKLDGIALRIWMDDLALGDVDPATLKQDAAALRSDRTRRAEYRARLAESTSAVALERQLRARVRSAIKTKLDALIAELATPQGTQRVRTRVENVAGFGAGWSRFALVDPLWADWVGAGRIAELDGAPKWTATSLYERLEGAANVALGLPGTTTGVRSTHFSATATAGRDAREVAAVQQVLLTRTAWVVGPAALEQLTTDVAAAMGGPAARSAEWTALNGRMRLLLIDAEARIVSDKFGQAISSLIWAEMRDRYVRTITKPIWRFWDEDIVSGSFFGHTIPKSSTSGLHRDVAAAVTRVEESAKRIGNFDDKGLKASTGTKATSGGPTGPNRPGSQFRFEAKSHDTWMKKSAHLSFHGTGRAMDFRLAANPSIEGEGHQLIGILAGEELPEGGSDRGAAADWAARLADLDQQRRDIVAARDLATGDERVQLDQRLADFDLGLRAVPQHATATRLRDNATNVWNRVTAIETAFQAAWTESTKGNPDNDKLAATLLARVDVLKTQVEAQIKALDEKSKGQKAILEQRLARLEPVRKMLAATSVKGKDDRDKMLSKVGSAAAGGLTDLPLWMVQAFAENGWNWGVWRGYLDSMHFDYMGPVSGVIDQ
jgi:hypothetical protein